MMRLIGRLALLVVAFILILSALGRSIGGVELSVWGLLLATGIVLLVRSDRRARTKD